MKVMRYIIGWSLALSLFGGQHLSAQVREVTPGDTVRWRWEAGFGDMLRFEFTGNVGAVFFVDWGEGNVDVYAARGDTIKARHVYNYSDTYEVVLFGRETAVSEEVSQDRWGYMEMAFGMEMPMAYVQGGMFVMGATGEQGSDITDLEKPLHIVTLSDFYIGQYEVTQAQWYAVMGTNPCSSSYGLGDDYPVYNVSWTDAVEFCEKLSRKTGKTYRLPTEAEWEYAARGGQKADGTKYAGSDAIGDVAWYTANSGGMSHPVGWKQPNGLGLYDMSGNVCEWCSDWYDRAYYSYSPAVNPQGASSGSDRVIRGGIWGSVAQYCRVSYRGNNAPGSRGNGLGFRVVCER